MDNYVDKHGSVVLSIDDNGNVITDKLKKKKEESENETTKSEILSQDGKD